MATQYLDLHGLSVYDEKLRKEYIPAEIGKETKRAKDVEGILGSLTTDAKDNLVNAINEVDANADAANTAIGVEPVEGEPDSGSGLKKRINALEKAIGKGGDVETQIKSAIEKLDTPEGGVSQTAGADGLALNIVETDGIITSISGSIKAETYDKYGAAAAVQGETEETVASVNTKVTNLGTNKADKVASAVAGNFAGLDANGNLTDSGKKASDFDVAGAAEAVQGDTKETVASVDAKVEALGTAAKADVATTAIVKESADENLVSAAQVASFVKAEIVDLEGAMHFRGVFESLDDVTNPKAGDVAIVGAKEYVYGGDPAEWKELGDESIYVTKATTIAGVDLQDSITKAELLTALNVADGAQVNVIEAVKVGTTTLTITDKTVTVPDVQGDTESTIKDVEDKVDGIGAVKDTDILALFNTEEEEG